MYSSSITHGHGDGKTDSGLICLRHSGLLFAFLSEPANDLLDPRRDTSRRLYQAEVNTGRATVDEWRTDVEPLFAQIREWFKQSDLEGVIEIKDAGADVGEPGLNHRARTCSSQSPSAERTGGAKSAVEAWRVCKTCSGNAIHFAALGARDTDHPGISVAAAEPQG
jgi:hypothetical protein